MGPLNHTSFPVHSPFCFMFSIFLTSVHMDFFIPLSSPPTEAWLPSCPGFGLWYNLQPSHSWKGQKRQCLPRNGCLCRNCLQPAPLLWEFRVESSQWLLFMSFSTEPVTYCENGNPLESFWQKYQKCHCNQIPLWMVTSLPKCPISYGIIVNFCREWLHSIKQDSDHPNNIHIAQTGRDWAGKGCWSDQPWYRAREENTSESIEGIVWKLLFPESHHGADGPVQEHINTFRPSHQRDGIWWSTGELFADRAAQLPWWQWGFSVLSGRW